MTLNQEFYDKLGKQYFTDLLKQYNCPFHLTTYTYDKVDIYFGRSSVGEIKYRRSSYPTYIIEENKVESLSKCPADRKYYIVVTDSEIFFWSLNTIRNYLPSKRELPINPERTDYRIKTVRYLPAKAADFHFVLEDKIWKLKKLN